MSEAWQKILDRFTALQREIKKNGSVAWYRGHRNNGWKLHSTLHRHINLYISGFEAVFDAEKKRSFLREEYKTLYRRFYSDVWPLLDARERSEWGILFSMQHYGLPTRLLDWTESFICALYFAHLYRKPDDEAAIFVLDPQKLNLHSVGREALIHVGDASLPVLLNPENWHPKYVTPDNDLATIAVVPISTNPRMVAQRSVFTLSGDSFDPLEEQSINGAIEKITLPTDTFDDVEAYLELAGIDAFNFFPDLEGLKMKHEAKTLKTISDAKLFYR